MATKANRFFNQAALEALLRFGPQEQALNDTARSAVGAYDTTVKQAKGIAAGTISQVAGAKPGLKAIFDRAGLDQARTATTLVHQDLAGLGGVANGYKAAAATEQANAQNMLGASRSNALADLSRRMVAAKEGRQWAVRSAGDTLQSDLQKVYAAKESLGAQKGVFQSLTASKLADAAAKQATQVALANARLRQSNINSLRASATSRENARLAADTSTANNKRSNSDGGSGSKKLTQAQQQAASDVVDSVLAAKNQWNQLRHAVDPKTGQPKRYSSTQIRAILEGSLGFKHGVVNTAADLALNKVISPANVAYLHRRNVVLGKYKLPYVKTGRKTSQSVSSVPGAGVSFGG